MSGPGGERRDFGVSSCSYGDAEPLDAALSLDDLLAALRGGTLPPAPAGDPVASRGFDAGPRRVTFEGPETWVARALRNPQDGAPDPAPMTGEAAADAAARWLPRGLMLLVLVEGEPAQRATLHLGNRRVDGEPAAAPRPPYAPDAAGFRFQLEPVEAAAFIIGRPRLALDDGDPVPVPATVQDAARRDLPGEFNVPLTLLEY